MGKMMRRTVDIAQGIIDAIGEQGARELLDVLTRSDEERAEVIGAFQRDGSRIAAETLMDLESDEFTRMLLVVALQERFT